MADDYSHQNTRIIMLNKEKEMQQLRDTEFAYLQHLVLERDELLVESCRRFEQLKTDFEYNLKLIQARDEEIEKITSSFRNLKQDYLNTEIERNNLLIRLEAITARADKASQQHEADKANWKVNY